MNQPYTGLGPDVEFSWQCVSDADYLLMSQLSLTRQYTLPELGDIRDIGQQYGKTFEWMHRHFIEKGLDLEGISDVLGALDSLESHCADPGHPKIKIKPLPITALVNLYRVCDDTDDFYRAINKLVEIRLRIDHPSPRRPSSTIITRRLRYFKGKPVAELLLDDRLDIIYRTNPDTSFDWVGQNLSFSAWRTKQSE